MATKLSHFSLKLSGLDNRLEIRQGGKKNQCVIESIEFDNVNFAYLIPSRIGI